MSDIEDMPEKERLQWIDYLNRVESDNKTITTHLLQKITLQLHVLTNTVKLSNPFTSWTPAPINLNDFFPTGKQELKPVEKLFLTMTEQEFREYKKKLSQDMGHAIASSMRKA